MIDRRRVVGRSVGYEAVQSVSQSVTPEERGPFFSLLLPPSLSSASPKLYLRSSLSSFLLHSSAPPQCPGLGLWKFL